MTYSPIQRQQRERLSVKGMHDVTCPCGVVVKTYGKGHPRYEATPPAREHTCQEPAVTAAPISAVDAFLGLDEVPRDGYRHPLIRPAEGGEPIPYTRVSTFAESLEAIGGLLYWKSRETAKGIARHEDLAAMVAALKFSDNPDEMVRKREDKPANKLLDGYIDEAICRVDHRAAWGTAVHGFTDSNERPTFVPTRMQPDVDSYYRKLEALGITSVSSECFVVNDGLRVAGTYDHIYNVPGIGLIMGDKKSGSMHPQKVALQLACYATGQAYDWQSNTRTPLSIRTDIGLLVHIPKDQGETEVYTVDLDAGIAAAKAALWVQKWRERDDLMSIVTPLSVASLVPEAQAS